MNLVEGKYNDSFAKEALELVKNKIPEYLESDVSLYDLFKIFKSLSAEIQKRGDFYGKLLEEINKVLNKTESEVLISSIVDFISVNNIKAKMIKELGVKDILALETTERNSFKDGDNCVFEAWRPLGVLSHILPSNSFGLSFFAIIEGLISKNVNLVKVSRIEFNFLLLIFNQMFCYDEKNILKQKVHLFCFNSSDRDSLELIVKLADGISCWGGEAAIKEIQALAPANTRVVSWGHKISFIYITQKYLAENNNKLENIFLDLLAENQMACSAPQCILIEDASNEELKNFAKRLLEIYKKLPIETQTRVQKHLNQMSTQELAELTNIFEVIKLRALFDETAIVENDELKFIMDYKSNEKLKPSPLFFTYWLSTVKRNQIINTTLRLRGHIQTVGLYSELSEVEELSRLLVKAGADRIRLRGQMLESYSGEPHDGVYALPRFMKRVSLMSEKSYFPKGLARLEDLQKQNVTRHRITSLMRKEEFQAKIPAHSDLYFKSGGSSGKISYSPFTYEDYHVQMRVAGEGLVASGLDVLNDTVANLYFAGGLYGGFISFFSILESLEAKQYPFAAWMDYEYVAKVIVDKKINVLMGMPSYIMQLFDSQKELLKANKVVTKIFYGGEHFTTAQIEFLKGEFGIASIVSGAYGSVDAGPLGFQCEFCAPGVHHLNITQELQILKLHSDEPVDGEEVGRLIFTSKFRDSIEVSNYEIGDLGRRVMEECPCGRRAQRFQLMGRLGDIFRAGGTFFNYNYFEKILKENLKFSGEFQIEIISGVTIDTLRLSIEECNTTPDELAKLVLEKYKDLRDSCVHEKTLNFEIVIKHKNELDRIAGSGKLRRVIDRRL